MQTFRHGDIAAAASEAEKGYKQFHTLSTEWAWKFRILQAGSLLWQGRTDRTLSLLSSEPQPPKSGDLAVQRLRLEGAAYTASNQLSLARQMMQEAERLCVTSDSPACANVTLDQGGLEMDRGHFAEAQSLFERALNLARSREDHFLEANSMLSLSQSALQQEHYDDAVDWSDRTYRLATALDFQDIAQNALGNLGWAYHKLGSRNGLKNFSWRLKAARRSSATSPTKLSGSRLLDISTGMPATTRRRSALINVRRSGETDQ